MHHAKQKYGDRVTEEKERVALLLCLARGDLEASASRTVSPSLMSKRGYIVRQGYVIKINAATVFISSSAKFRKGEVAGTIRVCAGQRSI